MPFRLTIDGETFNTDDLTVEEAVELERLLGRSWNQLSPQASAEQFQAFATAFLRRTRDPEEAAKIAASTSLNVALKSVVWVDDDLPDSFEDGIPKAEGGRGTTTSSGSPNRRGAGRQT